MTQDIKRVCILGFAGLVLSAGAHATDCNADNLNSPQALKCLYQQADRNTKEAEALYSALRKIVPPRELAMLEKDHHAWLDSMVASCALTRDAFNSWGTDYAPDSDFQNAQCRASTAEGQADFYKTLICPDSIEDGTKSHCAVLKKIQSVIDAHH